MKTPSLQRQPRRFLHGDVKGLTYIILSVHYLNWYTIFAATQSHEEKAARNGAVFPFWLPAMFAFYQRACLTRGLITRTCEGVNLGFVKVSAVTQGNRLLLMRTRFTVLASTR